MNHKHTWYVCANLNCKANSDGEHDFCECGCVMPHREGEPIDDS